MNVLFSCFIVIMLTGCGKYGEIKNYSNIEDLCFKDKDIKECILTIKIKR